MELKELIVAANKALEGGSLGEHHHIVRGLVKEINELLKVVDQQKHELALSKFEILRFLRMRSGVELVLQGFELKLGPHSIDANLEGEIIDAVRRQMFNEELGFKY